MKYVMAILLLTGIMAGQTRAQLKADNAELLAEAKYLADYATELSVQIAELQKENDRLKASEKVWIDITLQLLNQPAPVPQVVTRTVVMPIEVPSMTVLPSPAPVRVIHDYAPPQPVWNDSVTCNGYNIPTPGLTLTYSNCQ